MMVMMTLMMERWPFHPERTKLPPGTAPTTHPWGCQGGGRKLRAHACPQHLPVWFAIPPSGTEQNLTKIYLPQQGARNPVLPAPLHTRGQGSAGLRDWQLQGAGSASAVCALHLRIACHLQLRTHGTPETRGTGGWGWLQGSHQKGATVTVYPLAPRPQREAGSASVPPPLTCCVPGPDLGPGHSERTDRGCPQDLTISVK